MANYSLPVADQFASRHPHPSFSRSPSLSHSSSSSCALSTYELSADVTSPTCRDADPSTFHVVRAELDGGCIPGAARDIGGRIVELEGSDVTGFEWGQQKGIDDFDKCVVDQEMDVGVHGGPFMGKEEKSMKIEGATIKTDSAKIKWRSDKKEKQTVSAALLIALGVAGIILGS